MISIFGILIVYKFLAKPNAHTSDQSLTSAVSLASIFSDVKLYVTATFTIQGVGG